MDFKWLERGTSPVDWCERNYRHHPMIAELANTLTNVTFLIAAPILSYLFNDYARQINRGIYVVWFMFAAIGLASAYFHATLSLLGQLLDELMILWLLFASFGMWIPRRSYPKILKGDRTLFKKVVFGSSVFLTIMALLYPFINAFVLVSLGIPSFLFLREEFKLCKDERVQRLCIQCTVSWVVAMICWCCDRFLCDQFLQNLGLDCLHAVFHVIILYSSFTLVSLFAFFDVIEEHPEKTPVMKFWPNDFKLGFPYVVLKEPPSDPKTDLTIKTSL